MVAYSGSSMELRIGDGAVPSESFTAIGGMQVTQLRLEQEVVSADTVRPTGWQTKLPAGARSLEVSGEGVFTDSATEQALQLAAFSGDVVNYELHFGNGEVLSGAFIITRYERNGELGDVESFSLTLKSAEAISIS